MTRAIVFPHVESLVIVNGEVVLDALCDDVDVDRAKVGKRSRFWTCATEDFPIGCLDFKHGLFGACRVKKLMRWRPASPLVAIDRDGRV